MPCASDLCDGAVNHSGDHASTSSIGAPRHLVRVARAQGPRQMVRETVADPKPSGGSAKCRYGAVPNPG